MHRVLGLPQALLAFGIALALGACSRPVAISTAVEPVPAAIVSVSGSATGLKGTLVLLNNGADSLTLTAAGAFEFTTPIASGSAYAVTVQTQPSGQTCTLSNGAGTIGVAAITNVAVLCVSNTYAVSGTVSALTGRVTLQNNGTDSQTIGSNGSFAFIVPIASGKPYAVSIKTQPVGRTCTVTNGSGIIAAAPVTNVAVRCTANTYLLGGTVSGLNGTVTLQNNGTDVKAISASGAFTFATSVAFGNPYTVTVKTQPATQTCLATNGTGTMSAAAVTNVSIVCVSNTYTVGGAVSGLTGTVVLQNNGHDAQTINTDGIFIFPSPIVSGNHYVVTMLTQPAGQSCSVSNASGTMGASPVTNVAAVCAANTHTIGATVSGLVGSVVLQDNGVDNRMISADGAFDFSTPVAEGSTYVVTVLTQPATQTCTVGNGSGTVGSVAVTDVTVVCSTNAYTVGGTVSSLSGTVTLQNNSVDNTPINTNGSFTFSTPVAQGSTYNVTVQTQPSPQTCTITNGAGTMGGSSVTNVSVTCVLNTTTLAVSATAIVPVNAAAAGITVTNTGSYAAFNVSAILPGGWIGVTQDPNNCTTIAPYGGTCTLSFTSTTPYVAQGNITLTGDNVSSPPTTALAFSLDGYLVYAVPTASAALVIASADTPGLVQWGLDLIDIPGIHETSTVAGGDACNGATDGSCNTAQIVAHYGTPYGAYAAGLCTEITSDNSGTVALGTWYLPAICELGSAGQGASCPAGLPNVDTNLVQLGFITLPNQSYWSSSEFARSPNDGAWGQSFSSGSTQIGWYKAQPAFITSRCARAIAY